MKKILNKILSSAVVVAVMVGVQSCTVESPFSNDGEGEVRMNVSINSRLTRAIPEDQLTDLERNCVVRVSDSKGLLHRWVGTENVPNTVHLKYGSYTAEAWSGDDSEVVSFDKIFYKGTSEFSLSQQQATTQVNIVCKIVNVVASVAEETVDSEYVRDVKVNVVATGTESGVDFSEANFDQRAYFNMPQNVKSLTFTVTGKNIAGQEFTKSKVQEDVLPGHEYRLNLTYNPSGSIEGGGAFFDIVIDDSEFEQSEDVIIYSRPQFSWVEGDLDSQVIGTPGTFTSKTLRIALFNGCTSLKLSSVDSKIIAKLPYSEIDLITCSDDVKKQLKELGIHTRDNSKDKYFIDFNSEWFNSLEESDSELILTVTAVDGNGKSKSQDIRIANTSSAIKYDDPIVVDTQGLSGDMTAIRTSSATIPVKIVDSTKENPTLQYREQGVTDWRSLPINATRANEMFDVVISGLKAVTTYEYRVCAGEGDNDGFEFVSGLMHFTTESIFTIPNANFEEWSTYQASTILGTKTVILPDASGNKELAFWGSGNEGAATANKTLTDKFTETIHSGSYSARLASDAAMGIIAAGNIFTGYYVKTDGTNGVLSVGRAYDGSHPAKLRVYANYRPGRDVTIKGGNEEFVEIVKGGTDQGQIYAALTTEPIEIRTNPDNRKLFNKNDQEVLAYGEITWKEAFGPDGNLEMVEIPFEYNERARSNKPLYLVIVCSASKFGDYFCGSKTSVMCLDDFELIYE